MTDWRLRDQEQYLTGARVLRRRYRAASATWDHEHCDFCFAKLTELDLPPALHEGWQTEDERHWICDTCFADFRDACDFVVVEEGAAKRCVELHDARVVEVVTSPAGIVIRLDAFVHDDVDSDSCVGTWHRVDFDLQDATIERRGQGKPWVLDGSLHVDERVIDNMIPIPFRSSTAIVLRLSGVDYSLTARGRGAWVQIGREIEKTRAT